MKTIKVSYSWDYTESIEHGYTWSRQWRWGNWNQWDFSNSGNSVKGHSKKKKLKTNPKQNRKKKKCCILYFGSSVKHSHTSKGICTKWRLFIFTHIHTTNQTFKGDMIPPWATPNIGWYSKIYQLHLPSMTATFCLQGNKSAFDLWPHKVGGGRGVGGGVGSEEEGGVFIRNK